MNKKIKNQTVQEFLDDLVSKTPAPGGGSVAALMGATAASLVSMVCNLTIGKKKYAKIEGLMKDILKESEDLCARLLKLAEDDKQAFLNVIKAKYSEESLRQASEVPAETARLAGRVERLAKIVLEKGNVNAKSDAQIAVGLAELAQKGAWLNVEANK